MDSWVFSLFLPFADQQVVHLQSKRKHVAGSEDSAPETSSTTTSLESFPSPPETKSLLDNDNGQPQTYLQDTPCWRISTPSGTNLQSNTLLRLSYRPAWQGIPEYTRGLARRQIFNKLTCGATSSGFCRRPNASHGGDDPLTLWDDYTTSDVLRVDQTHVTIRGIGVCQAIQVYLKPKYATSLDEEQQAPSNYQSHWNLHRQRMGKGMSDTKPDIPTFSQPSDSIKYDMSNFAQPCIVLVFAIPVAANHTDVDPPLLWKVLLPPPPTNAIMLDTVTVLDGKLDWNESPTHVYIHGYQSWSFTGSIAKGQSQPKPALPNVFSRAFNLGAVLPLPPTYPIRGEKPISSSNPPFYQSDFFSCISTATSAGLDQHGGAAFVVGWVSQHKQFGLIGFDKELQRVSMHASHQAQLAINGEASVVETDWAYAQVVPPEQYDEEPMVHFLHAVAAFHQAKPLHRGRSLLTGWCSWYHYYENISQDNLKQNFAKLAAMKQTVPTNVAVVDDGYMKAWGDWDVFKSADKFTDMSLVSNDIQSYGMKPGIWLAPFACDKNSLIAKHHPEWIIRNENGVPANSSNCGKFFYGLDATNPNVRKHVKESIQRAVHQWGFEVLKIDFLYAACLEGNGKFDMSMTRAQAMHLALETIRQAAGPEVFLIGCGCPIGSGIGYVDGMRISADTGPTWYPALPLPWWDHGTLPALRAMIRNSMTRAPLGHRWWHNDPDCLLLGETTSLTDIEVASAASVVAMTCGMMLLSDDLTKVSPSRMSILTKIFPMTGVTAMVLDLHATVDKKGLPAVMRLWCTDKFNHVAEFRSSSISSSISEDSDHNAEATYFGRRASFRFDEPVPHPKERLRSCLNMTPSLGTWTVLSLSNWSDKEKVFEIPELTVTEPPPTGWGVPRVSAGYHVFSFWSGQYTWTTMEGQSRPDEHDTSPSPLRRRLRVHETEIFHIRPVIPDQPQYIGSDLHFSCGHEVLTFQVSSPPIRKVQIQLKTGLCRSGHIFLFVPTVDTRHISVSVAGRSPGQWAVVGNVPSHSDGVQNPTVCIGRVIQVLVNVLGDETAKDGTIEVRF
eukprot:Nitzschia sp. Nitz4//scaffold7_size249615//235022//238213//NITZ4_001219-RA/size249615-processed-gene-0.166-mRNA-1//1//CDS//3329558568//4021//frame0